MDRFQSSSRLSFWQGVVSVVHSDDICILSIGEDAPSYALARCTFQAQAWIDRVSEFSSSYTMAVQGCREYSLTSSKLSYRSCVVIPSIASALDRHKSNAVDLAHSSMPAHGTRCYADEA